MEDRVILKIIEEICTEENIDFKTHSFGYIMELTKNDKHKFIIRSRFDVSAQYSRVTV